MRRLMPAPPWTLLLAALFPVMPVRAQEMPAIARQAPAAPAQPAAPPITRSSETPAPTPSPTPAPQAATPPAAPAATPKPAQPAATLGATLDFARWQSMSQRERQTLVEGAIFAMTSVATSLRPALAIDNRTPPDVQAALVKFVDANYPRHPAAVYQKEMETIYLTAEGQKLAINECFLQAFRRANSR